MIIHNIEQHSEAWFEARCGRITGTRFKNLMSKENTDSFQDLITDMACEIITGRQEEGYTSKAMEEGTETEPEARAEYEIQMGIKVLTPGFITPDEDSPYYDWIGVSPDGLISGEKGGLEIKCPMMKTHFEYLMENRLPPVYRHQVQGSLFVTGYDYWDFMSYVHGMKPFIIRVFPDLELHEQYRARLSMVIALVQERLELYNRYHFEL